MIEEQATVIKCEEQYVWVQTHRQTSCGHCSVKNGCGTQVLSKVLGNKIAQVRCLNPEKSQPDNKSLHLTPGDRVVIGLKESALLSGSLIIYLLPLVAMLLSGGSGVFVAKIWWPEAIDLFSIVFSFTGLFFGLKSVQYYLQLQSQNCSENNDSVSNDSETSEKHHQFEPVILKKLPSEEHFLKAHSSKERLVKTPF